MAIFPTSLRKLLTEKEEAASASWSPLNDHPKHTQFLQHMAGRKKGGKKEKRRKEGGRQGEREGGRKEGRKQTNLFFFCTLFCICCLGIHCFFHRPVP